MRSEGFTDYYEVLQISPNAHPETIHRVYRLLAQMYHPDNQETGDLALFKEVLEAYKTLGDPEKRAAYDVEFRINTGTRSKVFDHESGVQGLAAEKRKRLAILSLLCTRRIQEPNNPTMTIVDLERLTACPREHLELALWYLRESGRISRSDSGRFLLTVKGLETLEEQEESETPAPKHKLLPAPSENLASMSAAY